MTTKANPKDQVLSPKEKSLFSQALTDIDAKRYSKALKSIEQVLEHLPTNGEALAAKALCLGFTASLADSDGIQAAIDLAKRGVMANLKSSESWMYQGLLYKHLTKYQDAMKCFAQSHKLNPDNQLSARELAFMQAQCGNWDAYIESRRLMLTNQASQPRTNWCGYALANHLAGRTDVAIASMKVLDAVIKQANVLGQEDESNAVHDNEQILFLATLYASKNDYANVIDTLVSNENVICDKVERNQMLGEAYLKTGKLEEAEKVYRWLLQINPDNYNYHTGLQQALGISFTLSECFVDAKTGKSTLPESKYTKLVSVYQDLAKSYPRCMTIKRIPLIFLHGDEWIAAVKTVLRERLVRGIPSLFEDMKDLYADSWKSAQLCTITEEFMNELCSNNRFDAKEDVDSVTPSAALWAMVYKAREYEYFNDTKNALLTIDKAIQHTPTNVDLYLVKGLIYRSAGNPHSAVYWINRARVMDTADRYINNTCVQYALEAGNNDMAERLMRLFIKTDDLHVYLYTQQCRWYHTAQGKAYIKNNKPSLALKNLLSVQDHFDSDHESLVDYHLYCPRKGVLRSYVDLNKYLHKDNYSHRLYVPAMLHALALYKTLDRRQSLEKDMFIARVLKNTNITKDMYISKSYANDSDKLMIESKESTMKNDLDVIIQNAQDKVEMEYSTTDQWKEHSKLLEIKLKKNAAEERVVNGEQHPDYDFFGWKNIKKGTDYKKAALKHANYLVNVTSPSLASILSFIDIAVLNDKPLLALQKLYSVVNAYQAYCDDITSHKILATHAYRKQVTGLPWFELDTLNEISGSILFPYYIAAAIHIAKMNLSTYTQHTTTLQDVYNATVAKYKKNGMLYDNIDTSSTNYYANPEFTSFSEKAIAACGVVLGYIVAANNGVEVDFTSIVNKYFDFTQYGTPKSYDRVILHSAMNIINTITGKAICDLPTIEGIELKQDEVSNVNLDDVLAKIKQFGKEHFAYDVAFMSEEEVSDITIDTRFTVEYVFCDDYMKAK